MTAYSDNQIYERLINNGLQNKLSFRPEFRFTGMKRRNLTHAIYMKSYYVYIMANNSGTLYIGMTSNLSRRVIEHKNRLVKGFSSRYNIDRLVYFEEFQEVDLAISREKQLKKWRREKKINLIEKINPKWNDLSISVNKT